MKDSYLGVPCSYTGNCALNSSYWSYCAECKSHTYSPSGTREHVIKLHAYDPEYAAKVWPD